MLLFTGTTFQKQTLLARLSLSLTELAVTWLPYHRD